MKAGPGATDTVALCRRIMTARDNTRSQSDNSTVGSEGSTQDLRADEDAQRILEILQRSGGSAPRTRILYQSQLPESLLDSLLADLEQAGFISIIEGRSGDRVELVAGRDR